MLLSEARHRPIVATSTADTVGRVDGYAIEAGPARIVAVRVGKADGEMLPWDDLTAFGGDAITVAAPEKVRASSGDDRGEDFDLLGKPALAETGAGLGTVTDAEFDPDSGIVTAVLTDTGRYDGSDLIGLGTYAAVFTAQR